MKNMFFMFFLIMPFSNAFAGKFNLNIDAVHCQLSSTSLGQIEVVKPSSTENAFSIRQNSYGVLSKDFYEDVYFEDNRTVVADVATSKLGRYSIVLWLNQDSVLSKSFPNYRFLLMTLLDNHIPKVGVHKLKVHLSGVNVNWVGWGDEFKNTSLGSGACEISVTAK